MPVFVNVSDRETGAKAVSDSSPTSAYSIKIARDQSEVEAAQALRYQVFNEELGKGLESLDASGLDRDRFDRVCDHLIVVESATGSTVGTYRLQTGERARRELGYYSEQEFEFGPFEAIRSRCVELGRACIAKEHRNAVTLGFLWRGIAQYAQAYQARYLLGCSSLLAADPNVGMAAYSYLAKYLVEERFRTRPKADSRCVPNAGLDREEISSSDIPRLMKAYLTLGARLCGEPAIDREFKTIDFLTMLDLESLAPRAKEKFFGKRNYTVHEKE